MRIEINIEKRHIFVLIVAICIISSIPLIVASPARSGVSHPADEVEPGIFKTGGAYAFPEGLDVWGELSVYNSVWVGTLSDPCSAWITGDLTVGGINMRNCNTVDTNANGKLVCGTDEKGITTETDPNVPDQAKWLNQWVNTDSSPTFSGLTVGGTVLMGYEIISVSVGASSSRSFQCSTGKRVLSCSSTTSYMHCGVQNEITCWCENLLASGSLTAKAVCARIAP